MQVERERSRWRYLADLSRLVALSFLVALAVIVIVSNARQRSRFYVLSTCVRRSIVSSVITWVLHNLFYSDT